MSDYSYTISSDFGNDSNNLDISTLDKSIDENVNISKTLEGIVSDGDDVTITFDLSLDASEETELNNIISSHIPIPTDNSFIYDAIVDKNGTGDYETIKEAIDSGAISILIRSGIYTETSDINLPNNFYIIGEDKNDTVVIFGMTSSGFVIDGGAPIETSGTISVTSNTNTITGVGTSFTNLVSDDFIKLGKSYHEILSIETDTSLTLKSPYKGPTINSDTYKATTLKTGSLTNISFGYSSSNLITLNKAINVSLTNIGCGMASNSINITDCTQIIINTGVLYNSTNGLVVTDSDKVNLTHLIIKNNSNNGILLTNSSNIVIDGLNISDSSSDGIKVVTGGDNIQIVDTSIVHNVGNGINTESNGNSSIQSCTITNNSLNGIITSGTAHHLIGGCVSSDNGSSGFDLSNQCVINGCMSLRNNTGIDISSVSNCSITGSNISDNTGKGVVFDSSTETCILSSNHILNNGDIGIDILGTDNIITSNIIKGNTTNQLVDGGTSTINSDNKT